MLTRTATGNTKYLATYYTSGEADGYFVNVSSAYLGFSFADPMVAGQTDYGYVAVSNSFGSTAPSATLTIDSVAYDTSGAAVTIGGAAVPEPASLTMLAMGASDVGAYLARRRKKSV